MYGIISGWNLRGAVETKDPSNDQMTNLFTLIGMLDLKEKRGTGQRESNLSLFRGLFCSTEEDSRMERVYKGAGGSVDYRRSAAGISIPSNYI